MRPAEAAAQARALLFRLLRNREALLVTAFSLGNAAAGLVANRVLTQLVPPKALGELYLLLNLALWFSLPSSSAFLFVQRHWAEARRQGAARAFTGRIARGLAAQSALVAALLLIARAFGLLPLSGAATFALLLACSAQSALQLLTQLQSLERRRVIAGALDLLGQPGRLLFLGLGATLLFGAGAGDTLDGEHLLWLHALWVLALLGLVAWLTLRLLRAVAPGPDASAPDADLSWRAALRYSLPFLGASLVIQLCSSAERWGLTRLDGPGATALFVQAVGLSTAATGAATSFLGAYFYPLIHQGAAQGPDPLAGARVPLRRFLLLSAAACGAIVLFGVTFAGPACALLFGPRYAAVKDLLPWTMAGAALFSFGQALATRFLVLRDPVGPNLALTLPLLGYSAALVFLAPQGEPALWFARLYCCAQALYVLLLAALSLRPRRAGP